MFADGTRCIEAWSTLPYIDERIPMKWLVPPGEASVMGSYEKMQEIIWSRPANTTNSLISTAMHLVSPYLVFPIWPHTHNAPRWFKIAHGKLVSFFTRWISDSRY